MFDGKAVVFFSNNIDTKTLTMRRVDFLQKAVWWCAEVLVSLDNIVEIAFSLLCTAALLCLFVSQLRTTLFSSDAKDQIVWSYFKFTRNKIRSREIEAEGWFAEQGKKMLKFLNRTGCRINSSTCHWPLGRGRHFKYHFLFSIRFGVFFTQLDFLIFIHPSRP